MTRPAPHNRARLAGDRAAADASLSRRRSARADARASQDPQRLAGTYLAARTADVEKDMPNAAAFYRSALEADPENVFLLERALVLTAAAGDIDEAVGFAKRLIVKQPQQSRRPSDPCGRAIFGRQGYAEAVASARRAERRRARRPDAMRCSSPGRSSAKARSTRRSTDLGKLKGEDWYEPFKLPAWRLHRACCRADRGGADALEKAHEARHQCGAHHRGLCARAGGRPAARMTQSGCSTEFLVALSRQCAGARGAGRHPRRPRASRNRGQRRWKAPPRRWPGSARRSGRRAGWRSPSSICAWRSTSIPKIAGGLAALSLGNLLEASGQGEAAIEVFESIAAGRAVPRAWARCGRRSRSTAWTAPRRRRRPSRRRSAPIPTTSRAYISYGNMLRGRERFAEAAGHLFAGDRQDRRRRRAPTGASSTSAASPTSAPRSGPKAEADFKQALELSPDQPLVLNYLGYSWVDMGMNLDEAMEHDPQGGRAPPERRLHRRQPRLGVLPARPLRRGGRRSWSARSR